MDGMFFQAKHAVPARNSESGYEVFIFPEDVGISLTKDTGELCHARG